MFLSKTSGMAEAESGRRGDDGISYSPPGMQAAGSHGTRGVPEDRNHGWPTGNVCGQMTGDQRRNPHPDVFMLFRELDLQ